MNTRTRLTQVDTIVGILCTAFLLGVLGMLDSNGQERAKRRVCAYQVREQVGGLLKYANDHNSQLPRAGTGAWLWDLDVRLANEMLDRGVRKESFFCPSNITAQQHMERYLTYGNSSWDGQHFRIGSGYMVCNYVYVIESVMTRPAITGSGNKKWLTTTDIPDAAGRELVVDGALSTTSSATPSGRMFGDLSGGLYSLYRIHDRTCHLRDLEHPWGGTIGFLDGHAAWRSFEEMEERYSYYPQFWW